MDPSILGTNPYSQAKVLTATNNSSNPDWGLSDPSSLADIHCWGIFVHGVEKDMSHSQCRSQNNKKISFGPRAGFF